MCDVGKRAPALRAIWVGSALLVTPACFEAEVTDFFEAPSAIVVTNVEAGGTAGAATGAGASGGTAGTAGSSSSGAAPAGGSSGAFGAGSGGRETGSSGAGGEPEDGAGGDATTGGEVQCGAYGATARSFGGHCYLLVSTPAPWLAAGEDCEQRGGHLVTVSSADRSEAEFLAENTFVWELAGMAPVWIAATDGKAPLESGDGTWYAWTNGEPMTFDNWSPSQPNNAKTACQDDRPCSCDQGTCYEHCGFLWTTAGKGGAVPGWNDRACEHELVYVCEWDAP